MRILLFQGSPPHKFAGMLGQGMGVLLSHSQAGVEGRVPVGHRRFEALACCWIQFLHLKLTASAVSAGTWSGSQVAHICMAASHVLPLHQQRRSPCCVEAFLTNLSDHSASTGQLTVGLNTAQAPTPCQRLPCSLTGTCSTPSTQRRCCTRRPVPSQGGRSTSATSRGTTTSPCCGAWC